MKNISLTINPNAITSLGPQPPAFPGPLLSQTISVSFSAQFDSNDEALTFSKIMLQHIQDFKE